MKKLILGSLITVASLGLIACQTSPISKNPSQNVANMTIPTLDDLRSYDWQLVKASDSQGNALATFAPVMTTGKATLNFQQNRMNFSVGCNNMSSNIVLNTGVLQSQGNPMSTLMACGDLQSAETLLKNAMQGSSRLAFQSGNGQSEKNIAILTQTTAQNNVLVWQGNLTPEKRYNAKGETIFLQVAPTEEKCDKLSDKLCLMVREISYNEQGIKTKIGDWHIMYEPIEGYQKSPNHGNVLRLKRYRTAPTDSKGYATAFVLDMIVETTDLVQ